MDVKTLSKITKWMESTDLEEVTWKNGGDKISLKVNNTPEPHSKFSSSVVTVSAPSIGVFRFARPGKANAVKQGMTVKKGAELGVVEAAKEFKPVSAPVDGNLKIVSVEDGQTVEYGQPLFFIEPR
ncbi:MAG TPA: biotin/lipoyl-binding protein [Elusimicrobiales bacterium]|nr:biotin/lipoyl-binding protein [Elusimicrobiales bacterium]